MSLFRPEALTAQRRRLFGSVAIQQPVRFAVMTSVLAGIAVASLTYAGLARFPRKETVEGRIAPKHGLVRISTAESGGVLAELKVGVGDAVRPGQTLAILSAERYAPQGSLGDQQRQQILVRLDELNIQVADVKARADLEAERLRSRAAALTADAKRLEDSSLYQRRQLSLAQRQLANIAPLVEKGFVSGIERDRREQVVLDYERSVSDLARQIELQRTEARDARSQLDLLANATSSELSRLRSARATIDQALAEQQAQGAIVLRAPVSGVVASIGSNVGQPVSPGDIVLTLAPEGALLGELLIPTKAAGHIEPGQRVRLMVEAFPFQKFGFLEGTIQEVARAPALPNYEMTTPAAAAAAGPSYRMLVAIDPRSLRDHESYGRLAPGMTLKADIVIARETALELLLRPIAAARARQLN